jgi:hypothetical protein
MNKWLLNTKKIKFTGSRPACDTNDKKKKQNRVQMKQEQEACVVRYHWYSYLKMLMEILQTTGQKISGIISIIKPSSKV